MSPTLSGIILPHHGVAPRLERPLYIAPNATIVGDVQAGAECSFWFGSVTRGDVHSIRLGHSTNVQDLTMLHVSYKKAGLFIGDQVTIGHSCILHGCTVGNRVLVGMGSVIMDNVVIEDDVLIGAGTLITEGTRIPSGSLVVGRPGAAKRPLSNEERAYLVRSADHYKHVARSYTGGPWPY
ncbi:MAG: gamma carbonic anhydrase family protein [Bdellovibrionales bacterium]|nr:gamma carbonic anhydrase family protein [Bdellovibrionales bacterium]